MSSPDHSLDDAIPLQGKCEIGNRFSVEDFRIEWTQESLDKLLDEEEPFEPVVMASFLCCLKFLVHKHFGPAPACLRQTTIDSPYV